MTVWGFKSMVSWFCQTLCLTPCQTLVISLLSQLRWITQLQSIWDLSCPSAKLEAESSSVEHWVCRFACHLKDQAMSVTWCLMFLARRFKEWGLVAIISPRTPPLSCYQWEITVNSSWEDRAWRYKPEPLSGFNLRLTSWSCWGHLVALGFSACHLERRCCKL